ncbi:MAG: NAD(P)-dependent oxidoreductase [Rhodospirillaceae bacterium]|jgi:UDP-glucose 4-epimerase|nr:NAD(P)-dependent oxidoreductase [Rhodospirillaceae bacterium]
MKFDKVAITGGNGRLGRHVAGQLASRCEVSIVDLAEGDGGAPFHQVDITDLDGLTGAFAGHDAVIHLAAIPNPRTTTQENTFVTNVHGSWAVLAAAEEAGVKRVVVASSDSTIGLNHNPPDWGPQYLPVDEAHPLRPIEAYSLSKHVTESICRSFVDRGALEVQVIRPSHIVFPPEYPELRQRGDDVENYHVWCYVAPEDVASGFVLALEREDAPFDTFILVADDGLNVRPTLEMLDERLGHIPKLAKPEKYDRLSTASILDNDHARDMLGWRPKITWRDMLKAPD